MKKLILGFAAIAMLISCNTNQKKEKDNDMNASDSTAVDSAAQNYATGTDEGQTVADIAMANDNFSTLVTAIKVADLDSTLQGDGPFTVFAPTNDAFNKLPDGTMENLEKPENKNKLTSILTYHVVLGEYKAADIAKAIKDNNGKYEITTVEDDKITASMDGENVVLTDVAGNKATVIMTDIDGSNGVIHAIDTVLMPTK